MTILTEIAEGLTGILVVEIEGGMGEHGEVDIQEEETVENKLEK